MSAYIEAQDKLDAALSQAHSILQTTYGGGGESFRGFNDTIQDNVLWGISELLENAIAANRDTHEAWLAERPFKRKPDGGAL